MVTESGALLTRLSLLHLAWIFNLRFHECGAKALPLCYLAVTVEPFHQGSYVLYHCRFTVLKQSLGPFLNTQTTTVVSIRSDFK